MASRESLHLPLSPSLCVRACMNAFLTHLPVFTWTSVCTLERGNANIYKSLWGDKLLSHRKTARRPWLSLHIYLLSLSLPLSLTLNCFLYFSLYLRHTLYLSLLPPPPFSLSFSHGELLALFLLFDATGQPNKLSRVVSLYLLYTQDYSSGHFRPYKCLVWMYISLLEQIQLV